ncbi:hypothetical protein GJ496_005220 [Pomphorhynchus laevis]|nr:hypothetical protein GJ496_005220 [Pomphorhynchus laevis]
MPSPTCRCGRNFTIICDHKPLMFIFGEKREIFIMTNGRLVRWAVLLSQYNYKIKYIAGTQNYNDDILSRFLVCDPEYPSDVPDQYVIQWLYSNHAGERASKELCRIYEWWPGIDAEVELSVKRCNECQRHRISIIPARPLYMWDVPTEPWQRLHIDIAGPCKGSYWLVLLDLGTKWSERWPLLKTTNNAIIDRLLEMFARIKIPKKIYCKNNDIQHIKTTPNNPQCNGLAERFIRTQGNINAPHSTTGKEPSRMMMGRCLPVLFDRIREQSKEVTQKRSQIQKQYKYTTGWRSYRISDGTLIRKHGNMIRTGESYWVDSLTTSTPNKSYEDKSKVEIITPDTNEKTDPTDNKHTENSRYHKEPSDNEITDDNHSKFNMITMRTGNNDTEESQRYDLRNQPRVDYRRLFRREKIRSSLERIYWKLIAISPLVKTAIDEVTNHYTVDLYMKVALIIALPFGLNSDLCADRVYVKFCILLDDFMSIEDVSGGPIGNIAEHQRASSQREKLRKVKFAKLLSHLIYFTNQLSKPKSNVEQRRLDPSIQNYDQLKDSGCENGQDNSSITVVQPQTGQTNSNIKKPCLIWSITSLLNS